MLHDQLRVFYRTFFSTPTHSICQQLKLKYAVKNLNIKQALRNFRASHVQLWKAPMSWVIKKTLEGRVYLLLQGNVLPFPYAHIIICWNENWALLITILAANVLQ